MKRSNVKLIKSYALTGILLSLCAATPVLGGNAPVPGASTAFGKSLAQWQDTYFRWWAGQLTIPPDNNGNAAVGSVVLMPLPNAAGDGTPAHLDVTLNRGQAFTLPLLFLLGTTYTDGTPPDPLVPVSFFQTTDITLQLDGVTVVNDGSAMNFYSQFYFAPPIPFDSPPYASVIWCEDLAIVHAPLAVGTHSIQLDLKTGALPPNFGGGTLEFHNSWTVTVTP